jgi:hypothetical protein
VFAPALPVALIALIALTGPVASPASSEVTADPGARELTLSVPGGAVPFAYPATVEAALGSASGRVAGKVTFLVDGEPFGEPVPVDEDGSASTDLTGLEPGEHEIGASFDGSAPQDDAVAYETLSVDSAAPGPEGILPCAGRKVVLTNAYRDGDYVKFEGVARYSLRGRGVTVLIGGRVLAKAKVGPDGTWWASYGDPARELGADSRFVAKVGDSSSWLRRLGQAVELTGRSPSGAARDGGRVWVDGVLNRTGSYRVVLTRQVGCTRKKTIALKQLGSAGSGRFRLSVPRPDAGEPYEIYRLEAYGDTAVSPPIIVRPAT